MKGVIFFHSETGTEGGYWAFQNEEFMSADGKSWSYDGLHTLNTGDHLTIYDKEEKEIVWQGKINLTQFTIFEEDAFGLWIHNTQIGVDKETWAKWFFDELPAVLERKKDGESF